MKQKPKAAAALSYDPEKDAAPRLIAAGRGQLAERIESLAREHGVPVYQNPDLAVSLTGLGIGHEIPPALYQVVAETIAWVYSLDRKLTQ